MHNRHLLKIILGLLVLFEAGLVMAGDVFNGREVFMRECMACHGNAGEGNMPGLPNFKESQTLFKTDNQLMDIIRDGRGIMPSFGGLLTDDDIRDVTAYLRSFL